MTVSGAGPFILTRAEVKLANRVLEALRGFIVGARQTGSLVQEDGTPFERVGCGCEMCDGALVLALAEGGGRCVLCACTWDDACGEGCAWEPLPGGAELLCTAHPPDVIAAAKKLIAKELRRAP